MTRLTPTGDYDAFSEPPTGVAPSDYHAAINARYSAAFHICPLPSGAVAVMCANWRIHYIGPPAGIVDFLLNPPPPRREKSTFTPSAKLSADELLAMLDLN